MALPTASVALLGGTGRSGPGLALRFAMAGMRVLIGSREAHRGVESAREVTEGLRALGLEGGGEITGHTNAAAAEAAETTVITVPHEGLEIVLDGLADTLRGRTVVSTVVPMRWDRALGPVGIDVPEGSSAERAAARLPGALVVAGFHSLSSAVLKDPHRSIDADVIVTGDDATARSVALGLAGLIEGVRPVDAGPLRYARYSEGLTLLLLSINRVHKAHTGVRVTDLRTAG